MYMYMYISAPRTASRECKQGWSPFGKGETGFALMGSLRIVMCLLTEGPFWGTPVNLLLPPQKCRGVPFSPQSVRMCYFCSGRVSADPICPHPRHLDAATRCHRRQPPPGCQLRQISLLRLSLLRFVDSKFPEIPYGHENSTP